MEKTQLLLLKWFWAMFLMGEDKRGCAALYLIKQLGVAYSTAWAISHKIRTTMGTRDTMYLYRLFHLYRYLGVAFEACYEQKPNFCISSDCSYLFDLPEEKQ